MTEASPIRQPLTLDDVAKRIDMIVANLVENARKFQNNYVTELERLAADVEASPDIDKNAVCTLVIGRVQTMAVDLAKAIG